MKIKIISLLLLLTVQVSAQTNESPERSYQWKNKKKTEFQDGFVVLKSGKRLEGQISLKGYYSAVEQVVFLGQGKEIEFPVAALNAYGLNVQNKSENIAKGIVNKSNETLYEWINVGTVMDKVVMNSVPRDGYVITKNGEKVEGMLKIQKRDDEFWSFQVKKGKDKQKFKAAEISSYGLSVSADQIEQSNLAKFKMSFYPGVVFSDTEKSGEIGVVFATNESGLSSRFKIEKVILESIDKKRTVYTPADADGFEFRKEGILRKYTIVEGLFIEEEFNGNTFQLFRNPNPTTINKFATNLVKTGVSTGTSVIASEISKADQKQNKYESNLDSIILVSSKEELIAMRDEALAFRGYSSVEKMNELSKNESYKNNVNAINLAISGREFSESNEGIYNKEWVILNKKTGEKTIVYKNDYKKIIEPLLYGCYDYLSLDKSKQKEYKDWKKLVDTVSFLDGCY